MNASAPPSESRPLPVVRGACPHDCPDTCGIITHVENGRAVRIEGDPDHPVTQGWLCAKVRPYLDHIYHPGRVLYPLRRIGPKGSGKWQRVRWDEALGEIGARWRDIIARFGPEAILPYSYSGTLGLVQMSVASSRFWHRLGASRLERSICGAAAELAVEATLGRRYSPPYSAIENTRLLVLWGHNPVSTAPHFLPFLRQAQRNGCQVVIIDPCRTLSARHADLVLQPIPGSDGHLALGIAHLLVASGRHDEDWLTAHTVGWPELRDRLRPFTPDRVAQHTGLRISDIHHLADLYASLRPGLIKIADGVNRNRNGGQNVRAICTLPAITGQYGSLGGGLAYSTSGFLPWNVQAVQQIPSSARVVNMNRLGAALLGEIRDPPLMSLFVFGANPATSSPNAATIARGLARDDLFTVVHDLFLTDTADLADLVLPATSQLEQVDLHKGYGHAYLTYNRPVIAPRGECRSNWELMSMLAQVMGFTDPWLHQSADEVIDQIVRATDEPAMRGVTLQRLQSEGTVPLHLDNAVPYAGGRFPTPSGKVELWSRRLADLGLDPLPGNFTDDVEDGELFLVTGAAHHFVSSSLASQSGLRRGAGDMPLEIHPDDAALRGIATGDCVRVENDRGFFTARAVVTHKVRPGVVATPKGRWSKLNGGRNPNWVTSDRLGDFAGQSTFHGTRVNLRKV